MTQTDVPVSSRDMWVTLVAMTLASSMILIDQTAVPLASPEVVDGLKATLEDGQWILTANILPLAAFLVLGGRIGDVFGIRRIFLLGAVVFLLATSLAGAAQDMAWMISARALQGAGAALMMPTAVAITSAVWPRERRGYALGILAGASAFFAALGPVVGGLLTAVNWRLVFLINVPLAVGAIVLTLWATPPLPPDETRRESINWLGGALFAGAIVALVYGLAEGQPAGWGSAETVIALVGAVVLFVVFGWEEHRARSPLIDTSLFRRFNFLASTISQVVAGMVELGLGYLLPFYLLLTVGIGPIAAGIALIPGTIPIVLAGPLAGRLFDRYGGRWPLVGGFLVLAASGIALGVAATGERAYTLIPGLLLQGIGLGVVLTVNDPVGIDAVDEKDSGQAAGIINTAEQVGGALGIAGLGAIQLSYYYHVLFDRLHSESLNPTSAQVQTVHDFIAQAEQHGLRNVPSNPVVARVYRELVDSHAQSFQVAFYVSSVLGLIGAIACFLLVRKEGRTAARPIFSRRSRWVLATAGASPGITRIPPDAVPQ
jgi:EmrB/QacA subfamily drug resistance transporter